MKQKKFPGLQKLIEGFNQRPERERVLAIAVVCVLIGIFWYELFYASLTLKMNDLNDQLADLENRIHTEDLKTKGFRKILQVSSKTLEEENHQQYTRLVASLKKEIKEKTLKVVNGVQMVKVLKDLLLKNKDLVLLKMENLPPKLVQKAGDKAVIEKQGKLEKQELHKLYQQSVKLYLLGDFRHLMTYLQTLEKLKWKFIWSELVVDAENYPENEIELTVSTLSLDKNFFGFQ